MDNDPSDAGLARPVQWFFCRDPSFIDEFRQVVQRGTGLSDSSHASFAHPSDAIAHAWNHPNRSSDDPSIDQHCPARPRPTLRIC